MHAQIRKYFDDECPFGAGVALYMQVGGTYPMSYFQGFMQGTWVPEAVDMSLRKALIDWMENNPDQSPAEPIDSPKEETPRREAFEPKVNEPKEITEIRIRAKLGHKQHSDAKGRLNAMSGEHKDRYTDAERLVVVREIMEDIVPALDTKYDNIRSYEETGELPKVNEDSVVFDTVAKMQRVYSLRTRVSKLPKVIDNSKDIHQKQKRQKELRDKQAELQALSTELGLT